MTLHEQAIEALQAQEAYAKRAPTPWGHECQWCDACVRRVGTMRRTVLELQEVEKLAARIDAGETKMTA
jgi:hypothetical protein